ncbi:MAG TPA: DNA-3-methyladenine glycosylase 2 family protein [Burkholderiales bacterium]|nr:DNA-3-methyladenine glycosylase 2 family protein [Burkholderiales bacterium]
MKQRKLAAPAYWMRAKRALARRDTVLAGIIRDHPRIALEPRGEPFFTLARSIVGQQISVKAAASIWARVVALAPRVLPEQVVDAGHGRLIGCGLSRRKAEYLGGLARHFVDGSLHVAAWAGMEDEAVIAELVQVRGIGRWTAEMFLMFCLLRPNVLPLDDLGLQRAICLNYFRGRAVSLRTMRKIAAVWDPWRSVATWYLWRSLDPIPVEY